MQVYYFTEQPYYPTWNNHAGSLRVNLPNKVVDPITAGDLFHRYYDEWKLADELGYNIMVNEHHQTATCMSSTVIVGLSVLARETKKARILVLGYPIGHRPDPLRCAEELATIDVDLARPARHGLHQGRALRIPGVEPESGRRDGPLLGGARLHPQGDDQPRRAVQLGGRVSSTIARSTSGRARCSSRIRRCGPPPATKRRRGCSARRAT